MVDGIDKWFLLSNDTKWAYQNLHEYNSLPRKYSHRVFSTSVLTVLLKLRTFSAFTSIFWPDFFYRSLGGFLPHNFLADKFTSHMTTYIETCVGCGYRRCWQLCIECGVFSDGDGAGCCQRYWSDEDLGHQTTLGRTSAHLHTVSIRRPSYRNCQNSCWLLLFDDFCEQFSRTLTTNGGDLVWP